MRTLKRRIRRLKRALRRAQQNLVFATRINRRGGRWGLLVVKEARRARLSFAAACTLLEKESNFRNVFGNDPVGNPIKGGKVTQGRYKQYLYYRKRGLGAQGVGPCQLTWPPTQDRADALGGCWRVKWNVRVGFTMLSQLIKQHGLHDGARRYNGSGSMAEAYADDFVWKYKHWKERLK